MTNDNFQMSNEFDSFEICHLNFVIVIETVMIESLVTLTLLAAMDPLRIWFAVPIIVSVSLVYAATRHEAMNQILVHAARFAVWIVVFMAIVFAALQVMTFLQ
jgi:hypothetical protein